MNSNQPAATMISSTPQRAKITNPPTIADAPGTPRRACRACSTRLSVRSPTSWAATRIPIGDKRARTDEKSSHSTVTLTASPLATTCPERAASAQTPTTPGERRRTHLGSDSQEPVPSEYVYQSQPERWAAPTTRFALVRTPLTSAVFGKSSPSMRTTL